MTFRNGRQAMSGPPPVHPESLLLDRLFGKVQSLEDRMVELADRRFASLEQQLVSLRELLLGRRKENFVVEEFAELVGRTPYTVRRWISEGKLKAIRIRDGGPRGKLLIPRSELERVIAAGNGAEVPEVALR